MAHRHPSILLPCRVETFRASRCQGAFGGEVIGPRERPLSVCMITGTRAANGRWFEQSDDPVLPCVWVRSMFLCRQAQAI